MAITTIPFAEQIAVTYIAMIGFFTGLLAVSTAAQVCLSHVVTGYADSMETIKTVSRFERFGSYAFQLSVTFIVGTLVFLGPFADVSSVVLGEPFYEGEWSHMWQIVVTALWFTFNFFILADTIMFSLASVLFLASGFEVSGSFLILLAASGSSDFFNPRKVWNALRVAWRLTKISDTIKVNGDKVLIPLVRVNNFRIKRMEDESMYVPQAFWVKNSVASALGKIGAPLPHRLPFICTCVKLPRFRAEATDLSEIDGPFLKSNLTLQQWNYFHRLLNVKRQTTWMFSKDKTLISNDSEMIEPRIAALELIDSFECAFAAPLHVSVSRTQILRFVRARAAAEWFGAIEIKDGFYLKLRDNIKDSHRDMELLELVNVCFRTTLDKEEFRSDELYEFNHHEFDIEEDEFMPQNLPNEAADSLNKEEIRRWEVSRHINGDEIGYDIRWQMAKKMGLDIFEHGNDWYFLIIETTDDETWKFYNAADPENEIEIESLFKLNTYSESYHNVFSSSFIFLHLIDIAQLYKEMKKKRAHKNEKMFITKFGVACFGIIRVVSKINGIQKLKVRGRAKSSKELGCSFYLSLGLKALDIFTLFWRQIFCFLQIGRINRQIQDLSTDEEGNRIVIPYNPGHATEQEENIAKLRRTEEDVRKSSTDLYNLGEFHRKSSCIEILSTESLNPLEKVNVMV